MRGEQLLAGDHAPADRGSHPSRGAAASVRALLDDLSDRKLDGLRLLARGRSNQETAKELFIGQVFAKLDVRDRAQAVVAAYESGLVRPGDGSR